MKTSPPVLIALGLCDHLESFSHDWALPWWRWPGTLTRRSVRGWAFVTALPDALAKADAIAFNLQGISELKAAFEAGQAGFQYAINARGGQSLKNVTNTELTTVLRDPALLAKTTFYDTRSKVIPTKDVLVRVGLS